MVTTTLLGTTSLTRKLKNLFPEFFATLSLSDLLLLEAKESTIVVQGVPFVANTSLSSFDGLNNNPSLTTEGLVPPFVTPSSVEDLFISDMACVLDSILLNDERIILASLGMQGLAEADAGHKLRLSPNPCQTNVGIL